MAKLTLKQTTRAKVDDDRVIRKKERSKIRRARRENPEAFPAAPKPITTEDKRIGESTVDKVDPELQADSALDELNRESDETKTMVICASETPGERTYMFMQELCFSVPNCQYFKRKTFPLKKIATFACTKGFTSMIIIQEKSEQPDSLFLVTLPEGPTAYYKLSSVRLGSEMKHSVPCNAEHKPEILVTNFKTRLGLRVAKQLETVFPPVGDDVGRRSIVFHNQRDFIFFRHYRYVFRNVSIKGNEDNEVEEKESKRSFLDDGLDVSDIDEPEGPKPPSCQLKEIGPRFTMRLRSLQLTGIFDKRNAEYEYMWRPDVNVNRAVCEL